MGKQIEVSSSFGNIAYTARLDVSEAVEAALLKQGALRILQGKVSGQAEKELAGYDKRPAGYKRTDIPWSEANGQVLAKHYKGVEVEIGENEKGESIMEDLGVTEVIVSEYVPTAGAEPKYAFEKGVLRQYLFEEDGKTERKLKTGEPRSAASYAESRGLVAPTEPWEEDTEFLKAVKFFLKAQASKED